MGGVTLLVLYLYGTLLSENVFGGIYGVISYVMFHSFAAKIYERPMARENFAFPFIFLQMFYLCICIGRVLHRQKHTSRLCMVGRYVISLSHSILMPYHYPFHLDIRDVAIHSMCTAFVAVLQLHILNTNTDCDDLVER